LLEILILLSIYCFHPSNQVDMGVTDQSAMTEALAYMKEKDDALWAEYGDLSGRRRVYHSG
jgi:hypothetical protein